ncbi:hypothetical protein RJ639_045419 [Escallonia herrerae]|uniref:Integrase catalytic domain-containing protein n=1 Tax=Escallonia herrerae TaxID=1293975 RepID=A0AA88WA11_9ASTE|nr:hypothetical protein RJ639_045419 [Escallonia herrerae]
MPTMVQIPPPVDMGTALPLSFSFPSAGPSKPPIPIEMTTTATHTAPAPGSTQVDLLAVISTMQKSIEKLQAAIEQWSEPHLDQATHINTQKQLVCNRLISLHEERHEGAGMYMNDPNQHFIHIDDESDEERRNPRLRRQENSYEVYSRRDTSRRLEMNYYDAPSTRRTMLIRSKENRSECYMNAPVIIGRPFAEDIEFFPTLANFKMPQCDSYDGTGDLMEHLARFTSCMNLHLVPDQIMCRAFPVTLKGAAHAWGNQRRPEEAQLKDPPVINTISGGPSAGGLTNSSRKAYARQVNLTQGLTKRSRTSTSLEFNDSDLEGVICPHDDALVITLQVDAYSVKCILVDTGSSADIIFEEAFSHMRISKERVKPISSPLYGFTGASAPVEGIIPLTIIAGTAPLQSVQTIDFLVVKVKSSYNKILGRTGLNKLRAVASTYHLAMKFPTPQGVGVVKGDQSTSQKCYITSCKAETFNIDDQRDEQVMRCATPIEKLVSIPLKDEDDEPECQASFEALKEYLASPPLLSKPIAGEMLFLYLAIIDFAVSAVLIREEDSKQFPVYYVSKVLQGAELCYPTTEKLAFALLIAARKLHPYFQSHTIMVLTDKLLRRILHKPDLSGRLVPWSIELGEFDIQHKPRPSIKGQALADFIVECTLTIDEVKSHVAQPKVFAWTLYVDGSSNTMGSGTARYAVVKSVLYKRSFSLPYLRCLTPIEADYALREVHEGICGQHLGRRALAHKILRQGYYWPTMQHDALEYTKKCDACQRFASIPKQAPNPLTMMKSPIPFAMWGMDILGPFPLASAQHKFVIVAIDYFTKWVEVEALATIMKKKCEDFFWRAVICRFGIPRVLITDNGKQFDNTTFRAFCANLSIEHHFTSVAHPQTNGQTEVTNRTLLQGLKKKLDGAKGLWVEELPKILWAYHTTTRTATGKTPFSLAFGTEAIIPLKIGLPSARVITYNPDTNDAGLRGNLDLLDESRDQAAMRLAAYQHRVAMFLDKRVRSRAFCIGDLVLRRIDVSIPRDAIENSHQIGKIRTG